MAGDSNTEEPAPIDPVHMLDAFLGEPWKQTGNALLDGQMLNAQVAMRMATNAQFTGGLREALIALFRSGQPIAPWIKSQLADALERGVSGELPTDDGASPYIWRLKLEGFGSGSGTQNNQGEQVKTRRRWAEIGEYVQAKIEGDGHARGARQKALDSAMEHFAVSKELAEKSLKYSQDRQVWVEQKFEIDPPDSTMPLPLAIASAKHQFDCLHARGKNAPREHLEQLRKLGGRIDR